MSFAKVFLYSQKDTLVRDVPMRNNRLMAKVILKNDNVPKGLVKTVLI